jgi:hypothetical protein
MAAPQWAAPAGASRDREAYMYPITYYLTRLAYTIKAVDREKWEDWREQLKKREDFADALSEFYGEPTGITTEQLICIQKAAEEGGAVRYWPLEGGTLGLTNSRGITLQPGLGPTLTASVLFHEWAHRILHLRGVSLIGLYDQRLEEVEAEAVSYIITSVLGVDNSWSAKYICTVGGSTGDELQNPYLLRHIRHAVQEILDELTGYGITPPDAELL